MATSGAMSTTNDKIKYNITITQNSRNTAANTSSVTVSVKVYRTNTGYTTYGTGTVYVTINGTQYTDSITTSDKITSSGVVIFSKTLNIAHDTDGGKKLTVSARITHDQFTSSNQSYSQELTAIPRATTPTLSASSVDMGKSITITLARASGSFTHDITYKFGNATGTVGTDIGTSKAWTVPLSLASEIPSGTSGSVTLTVKTMNGNTLIGTKTVSFTAKVPSSVLPAIDSVAVADTNSAYQTKFGSLVQNKSKAKFAITASGAYGSTITSYKTVIEGKTYTGATPTTAVLTGSGNVTATITVTDSRGRTASTTKTFALLAYTAPKVTVFEAHRTDAAGNVNYEGTNAKITAAFSIASASSKNTNSYKIEYKLQSASTWTTLASGTGYTYDKSIISGAVFDVNYAYDIRLTVTDYFGSVTKTVDLPTAFTLLDFNASGRGVAFGKVSEREGVEFALPTWFSHGETPSSITYLQSGQDFDAILEPGFYAVPTTAISGTLLNKPWDGTATGSLIVLNEGDGGQRCQIAHKGNKDDGAIYERAYYQKSWGEWHKVFSGIGTVLWSGSFFMNGSQVINLSEPVSKQSSGIVLMFSRYSSGKAQDYHWNSFFISKGWVRLHESQGHQFFMTTDGTFSVIATKYLYIHNDKIGGNDNNEKAGTANGITYNNAGFVLRYVIGV